MPTTDVGKTLSEIIPDGPWLIRPKDTRNVISYGQGSLRLSLPV